MIDRGFYWCSIDMIFANRYATCAMECPELARILVAPNNNHTSCLKRNPIGISLEPNQSVINTILSLHNDARNTVNPSATSMSKIIWDFRLARIAQKSSDQCTFGEDCNDCRTLLNNRTIYVGQNSFAQFSYGAFSWETAINSWLNEKKNFLYGVGSITGNWEDVGHYTLIINDGVYAVGCGATRCGNDFYMYCNYASGQYGITVPYTSGTPCSNCSSDMCIDNLCQCNKICQNYGTLNSTNCTCMCQPYATGEYCEKLICTKSDQQYGCWAPGNKNICMYSNTVAKCPFTCGICQLTLV